MKYINIYIIKKQEAFEAAIRADMQEKRWLRAKKLQKTIRAKYKKFYKKVKMTKKAEKGMQNYEMNLAKIRIFLKICTTVAEKMHKIVRMKKTYVQMHKNGQKGRRVSVLSS